MSRAHRFAVLWLLAVALPWQNVALASTMSCGAAMQVHADVQGLALAHAHADVHAHAHATGARTAHGSAGMDAMAHAARHDHAAHVTATADQPDTGPAHHAAAAPAKAAGHACSACASCCAGAGVALGAVVLRSPVALTGVVAPWREDVRVMFLSERLERPPRPRLA